MKLSIGLILFGTVITSPLTAAPGQGTYAITDLGTFGGTRSEARVINNRGWVLCIADGIGFPGYVLWQEGVSGPVSSLLPAHPNSTLMVFNGMNNYGVLAGRASFAPPRGQSALFGQTRPYKLFASVSEATAINDLGVGAGFAYTNVPFFGSILFRKRAVRFYGNETKQLGGLTSDVFADESEAFAINDRGTIVGRARLGQNVGMPIHAFRWLGSGAMIDVHSTAVRTNSVAIAVNNRHQITGYMFNFPTLIDSIPFLWDETNGMVALPLLPGDSRSTPLGMNNFGEVVGTGFASGTAVLWKTNTAIALQDLLPAGHGWDLDVAYSINDYRQIVGYGKRSGVTRAFLMSPTNVIPPVRVSWELIDPQPGLLHGAEVTSDKVRLSEAGGYVSGVAADGASRMLIRLESAVPGTFTLSLDPLQGALTSGNAAEDGSLGAPGVAYGQATMTLHTVDVGRGPQAFVVYHAPEYFDRSTGEDASSTRRTILASLNFKPDSAPEQNVGVPIVIARPPILVMHGLWSNRSDAFGKWEREMQAALPGLIIDGPDYNNSAHFAFNDSVVWFRVLNVRGLMRQQGIVATRVDVFAHSMGGLLSRIWTTDTQYKRPDNYMQGDINRLITIDTPHLGSFVGDIAWSLKCIDEDAHFLVAAIAEAFNKSAVNGAAEDLSSFSGPLHEMHMKRENVPSHAISGDTNLDLTIGIGDLPVPGSRLAAKLTKWVTGFKGITISIPTHSDYVVWVDSQAGGLLEPEWSPFQHEHSGAANQDHVIARSQFLLRASPRSMYFAPGFPGVALPNPPCLFDGFAKSKGPKLAKAASGGIAITSLTQGQHISSGSTRTVIVEPVDGFQPVSVLLATRDHLAELTNAPFNFSVRFPSNYIGPQTIMVAAADAASNIVTTNISVVIDPVGTLNELRLSASYLHFGLPGSRQRIEVRGDYSDGNTRNLTAGLTGTTYVSSDTNVVIVDADGELTARTSGFALVTVSNGSRQAVVEVDAALAGSTSLALSSVSVGPQQFTAQPVTFSMFLTNLGPQTASNAVLTAALPPGAEFVSSNLGEGSCSVVNGVVICALDNLTNGAVAAVSLTMRFSQAGTNRISFGVSSSDFDSVRGDNRTVAQISVSPAPQLGLRSTGGSLILSVENLADGFTLEVATNLNPPLLWFPAGPLPPMMTNRIDIELPLSDGPAFYRLRKP